MHVRSVLHVALAATFALGGCSASQQGSSLAPQTLTPAATQSKIAALFARTNPAKINRHRGWIEKTAVAPFVYVADQSTNQVLMYEAGVSNPSPVGSIQYTISAPTGLWVDSYGDLFVCNTGTNTVEAFFPGRLEPYLIINGPDKFGTYPNNVTVDQFGNVWVVSSTGVVTEYAYGTTTAVRTLSNGINLPFGIAIGGNTVYVAQENANTQGSVVAFKPGWTLSTDLHLAGLAQEAEGIAFGPSGVLYVADTLHSKVLGYPLGHKNPTITITDSLARPEQIAFDAHYNLYVTNLFGGNVTYYAKGSTTASNTIATGLSSPRGVAVTGEQY